MNTECHWACLDVHGPVMDICLLLLINSWHPAVIQINITTLMSLHDWKSNFDWFLLMIHWRTNTEMFLCYIKQVNSMLPCACSIIDHRWRQNVVRTSVTHSAIASCATFFAYHILMSSVIYYWTDTRQHEIYLLNRKRRENQSDSRMSHRIQISGYY